MTELPRTKPIMNTCTIPQPITLDLMALPQSVRPRVRLRHAISPGRLIKGFFKLFQCLLESRFPNWSHVRHQARWERKWARPDYNPFWRTEDPQKELVEAIETGWFPKEDWIYDIGCGAGESSRWLGEQGLSTLGLDFSAAAIDICRRLAGNNERLRFEVIDICAEEMSLKPAAAMLDRGCFHQIPEHFRPAYVRNAARLIQPGGHFLLIAATYQRDGYRSNPHARSEEKLGQEVEQLFRQHFQIERTEPTTINTSDRGEGMPAVAFWMSRHGELSARQLVEQFIQGEPSRNDLGQEARAEELQATA